MAEPMKVTWKKDEGEHGTVHVSIGGMWEESEWKILFNTEIDAEGITPCKHAGPVYTSSNPNAFGGFYMTSHFRVPRVVVVRNEAGFNSTGACLDCILDAAEALKTIDRLKGATVALPQATASLDVTVDKGRPQ